MYLKPIKYVYIRQKYKYKQFRQKENAAKRKAKLGDINK